MAIDTDAKKFSLLAFGSDVDIALPATGTLNQADLQHMLWGYIDPLWTEADTGLQACIAIAAGTVAAIALAEGTVAAIAFAESSQAVITFTAISCD